MKPQKAVDQTSAVTKKLPGAKLIVFPSRKPVVVQMRRAA